MLRSFIQLIRWKNLLIVLAAQVIVWTFVNYHFSITFDLLLSFPRMILLVLSTILIAAAGYIINDYFDIKIDSINRPNTLIISNQISKFSALTAHIAFSVIGFILGAWVAYLIDVWWLCGIQFITIGLLWYYSTHFKRMSLIGNLLVSFLTALSILLMLLFEPAFHPLLYMPIAFDNTYNPSWMIVGIAVFAFLLNLMREIVKDMEDFKGDAEQGCRTYPIVKGLKRSTLLVQQIGWLTIGLLLAVSLYIGNNFYVLHGILIIIPALGIVYVTQSLSNHTVASHYNRMSNLLKWIMVIGLALIILISYIH